MLAYDPGIAVPFNNADGLADIDLWQIWDAIRCPVLVLRGESSDLLSAETAAEMRSPTCTFANRTCRPCGTSLPHAAAAGRIWWGSDSISK